MTSLRLLWPLILEFLNNPIFQFAIPDIIRTFTRSLMMSGYYNTWTEEVHDVSETDEDNTNTEAATTEDDITGMSPGAGPDVDFGVSTGGLDFMSSSGYPQIEFGYDDPSDDDEDSDEDEEDSGPDDQISINGRVDPHTNLVSNQYSSYLRFRLRKSITFSFPFH